MSATAAAYTDQGYYHASGLLDVAIATIDAPTRRTVSQAAIDNVKVLSASGTPKPWCPRETPYMVEPMDDLESRKFQGLVFVAPAQCGKTRGLIVCWIAYTAVCSPASMMVVQATQKVARRFERTDFRETLRLSPAVARALSTHGHDDNTFDKTLRSGDTIFLTWPSSNELQGIKVRRMALTDYDRMPLVIGNQGSPFELSRKRNRTFRSLGMTLAESSPGHEQADPQWTPTTPHDAPPAKGILSLYRLGDRRRLYWPCPHCGEYFMSPPGPDGFQYEVETDLLGTPLPETLGRVTIGCPHCSEVIEEAHRPAMLECCRWVPDFCTIDRDGNIHGDPPKSDIASFWLHGVHAAYTTWHQLIYAYLQAKNLFAATHDEEPLRAVILQDFGAPYIAQARTTLRLPTELEQRKERYWRRGHVPVGVRWITALIDTQGRYWSIMIVGRGISGERWVIDRFEIRKSTRIDGNGDAESVDPAAYLEDWQLLTDQVVCSTWPLVAYPGKRLAVRLTLVDSGGSGKKGDPAVQVTSRAYDWWRSLRRQGLSHRVAITKGIYSRSGSRSQIVRETYPDASGRADRHSGARGDVPLYLLDVNALKDALDADLKREEPGPGFVHFPDDMPASVFDELTSEVRTESGWELAAATNRRNEAWDQLAMDLAANLLPQDVRGLVSMRDPRSRVATTGARIDWQHAPIWAGEIPLNSEVDRFLEPVQSRSTVRNKCQSSPPPRTERPLPRPYVR